MTTETYKKNKSKKNRLYRCPAYLFCVYELLDDSISQIAENNDVSKATIWNYLKKFNLFIPNKMVNKKQVNKRLNKKGNKCDFCGFPIWYNGKVKHINIEQNPSTHYFCSKDCLLDFIFVIQRDNTRTHQVSLRKEANLRESLDGKK